MEICSLINRLIQYALKNSLITEDDIMFVRNELMALLHLKDWQDIKEDYQIPEYPQEILDKICDYAVEKKIIEDGDKREIFWNEEVLKKSKIKQPYISELAKELSMGGNVLSIDEFINEFKK